MRLLNVLPLTLILFVVACQSPSKGPEVELNKEVTLQFRPKLNRKEHFRYLSESRTKTMEDGALRHQRDQVVDFELVQVAKTLDEKKKTFKYLETTVKKDGLVPLEVFGLPDIGEAFERVYDWRGNILSAGNFPKDSFYMVPYMVFPEGKVKPGSTWDYTTTWKMGETPFKLESKFKLERVYRCKKNHECVEIDIEAKVIPRLKDKTAKYDVFHKGKILFDLTRSSVLWGHFQATESIDSEKLVQDVKSCVGFKLVVPEIEAINDKIKCGVL